MKDAGAVILGVVVTVLERKVHFVLKKAQPSLIVSLDGSGNGNVMANFSE